MVTELTTVPSDGPFHPEQGQTHQQEGNQVRDEERATSVLDRLGRKTEKVAEADGIAGHGEHEADTRAPLLF